MSVILDALERAKQEKARRKTPTRPFPGHGDDAEIQITQIPVSGSGAEQTLRPPTAGPSQATGLGAALFLIATVLVLLLATTVGLVAYLFFERERARSQPQTTATTPGADPTTPIVIGPGATTMPGSPTVGPGFSPSANPTLPLAELPISVPQGPDGVFSSPVNPGGRYSPQVAQPPYGLPAPTTLLPKLGSIICDERGCTAMLDGRSAREGDVAGDFQVLHITQDAVTLRDTSGQLHSLGMRR